MKKTLSLASLLAIVATTGVATANTDVNFAGDYQLGDGSTANVGTALSGSTYTYTYTKSDSSTATVAQDVDPDLHFFTYTDKNGNPANLYDGGTDLTAASFDGATVADGTTVISHQTIAANETISRSNYEYVDGKGETATLGDSARSFTETVALNSTYATVASVDVTDGSAAPVLAGTMYSYTDPDTGAVYHLNATGDEWVDANNLVVIPDAGTPQEVARDAMVAAFAADSAAIATAKTTVDGYATAEATAFAAADGVYTTDAGTISTLTTNYGTYTDATTLLGQAQTAQTARQGEFAADQALEAAAADLYNTPIETVQAATLQDAKDYADGLASNYDVAGAAATAETNANAYADSLASNYDAAGAADTAESNAKSYADSLASNYDAAGAAATAESNAKSYTDTEVGKVNTVMGKVHGLITADSNDVKTFNGTNATASKRLDANGNYVGNLAVGTTVEDHLVSLDNALGDEAIARANGDAATLSTAQTYADAGDAATLSTAQTYADAGDAATLSTAQTYADAGDALTLQSAKAYADKAGALNLQAAKSYTDERIKKLDKDLSAGVAGAVALSSVAVSNVQKGEVSVGAGYGYFNGQSAVAFGAAMGLSDRWSINTGAGVSGSDFSIRAGTNYKFKLF